LEVTTMATIEITAAAIAQALRDSDGNRSQAAKQLGVSTRTLGRRIEQHADEIAELLNQGETAQDEITEPAPADEVTPDADPEPEPEVAAGTDEEEAPAEAVAPKPKGTYKSKPADKACACGCGELTARTFARGHDSKYASALRGQYKDGAKTREEVLAIAKGISDRFHGKLAKSLAQADRDHSGAGTCPCCDEKTARTFVRGHDSRYAKALRAKVAGGEMTRDEALEAAKAISERFHGKVTKALDKDATAGAEAADGE
jgi:hypothetical protein